MKELSVKELYQQNKEELVLTAVSNPKTLEKRIHDAHLHRPSLALTGFYQKFPFNRVQILGETEIIYLQSLPEDVLFDRLKEIMMYNIPCIIVSKGHSVPSQMEFLANELNIAVLISRLSTGNLFWRLSRYLQDFFNPSLTMHGTLVDVYGVGIFLTGKSGIGKSECALELVERGHGFVSDDLTTIKSLDMKLLGSSQKDFGYFMEVRGVGIIDIERMFGIQSVRKETLIDVQVELMQWNENMDYERIGLGGETTDLLGIKIPIINIPVSPGKNVAVIIEVIAMNHILKTFGYDAAQNMQQKLADEIQKKTKK
ncbi:MAG: HPr(Ser) kinase/phosphatase [Candidatus Cloacimonetes bacterium]|nr:HPr(Ser) kinase/phosphatase [Candidatus Cloacimonadota bacterium]